MAGRASLLIDVPPRCLLGIEAELRIGFCGRVVAATGEESQENESGKEVMFASSWQSYKTHRTLRQGTQGRENV